MGVLQPQDLNRRGMFNEEPARQTHQLCHDLIKHRCLLRRDFSHNRPLIRDDIYQSLALQLPQRFAYQRSADADGFAKVTLNQAAASGEVTDGYAAADSIDDLLTQRRGDLRDAKS